MELGGRLIRYGSVETHLWSGFIREGGGMGDAGRWRMGWLLRE
jgi:hypothetical protein